MKIDGRKIGAGEYPYLIAELSGNHKGEISRAFELMDAAREAGADAVKLQTYTADTITIDHDGPGFTISGGLWDGRRLHELYREAHTPWEWHQELFEYGKKIGISVFSSPFDHTAIDLLESLDAPAYKIASFEAVDIALIKYAASTGKPLIISTGVTNHQEIGEAVAAARSAGCQDLALLHCVSNYPAKPEDMNLNTIPDLGRAFDAVVGLSDHTPGHVVAVASVALGATVIEKHLTLRRADGGPDAAFSMEPDEFAELAKAVRTAHDALGSVNYSRKESAQSGAFFKRSLYAVANIAAGETLSSENVRSIRPGLGMAPKHLPEILGKRAKVAIARGTPMSWDLLV